MVVSCIDTSAEIQFGNAYRNTNLIVTENIDTTKAVAATPEDEKGIFGNIGKQAYVNLFK